MPVSEMSNIAPIMQEVVRLRPKVVVDLGVGGGKYGVLCREALDWVHGRCAPETWQAMIVGMEGFESYRNPAWSCYTNVEIVDFVAVYEKIQNCDLVMMIDSLEHLDMPTAKTVLETLVKNNKHVIISVPIGECPQGEVFGNTYEKHRSTWSGPRDFLKYNFRVLHEGVCCVVSIKGEA